MVFDAGYISVRFVTSYIGVFGPNENIASSPNAIFQPPPKPRCTETPLKKAC
jgi:hypothetical protein